MLAKELRNYNAKSIRADETAGGKIIEGHAVVFDSPALIGGQFYEVIERGAFKGCDLADVALLVNHDNGSLPLARTTSGTLSLSIDDVGLKIRAQLDVDNSTSAKDLFSAIKRRDIDGMSFAFIVADDEWQNLNDKVPTRIIKRFEKIFEVSACTRPAYSSTDIQARAQAILAEARKEADTMTFEQFKAFMTQYEATKQKDDEEDDDEEDRSVKYKRAMEQKARREREAAHANNPPKYIPGKGFIPAEEGKAKFINVRQREQAGKDLKERRAVESTFDIFGERRTMTVQPVGNAEATLIVPDYSSPTINPDFPVVSSLVDAVAHLTLHGGNSYSHPYVTGIESGGYTQEGEDYHEAETAFDYAQINRSKITAYCELTEELRKLPDAAYAEVVFQNIRLSIRKVLSQEILFGAGISNNQNRIVGIFSTLATAIDSNTDLALSAIDDKTLAKIIFSYGGDEDVESPSCLILNKLDLLAFDSVRTATGQNFYDIQYSGGGVGGKINGVPFIINSACKALMDVNTASGDYCMAYGHLSNYQLVEFSPLEVERSDDFKFRKGITCFRGSAIVGGNVIRKNGFLRITKS